MDWIRDRFKFLKRSRRNFTFSKGIETALYRNINGQRFPSLPESELERLRIKWGTFLEKVSSLEGVESSSGNKVEILESLDTIEPMISAIDSAVERVWVETYIFDDSESVARRITDALIRAKKRGCDVVVIMDYIGSLAYPWRKELEGLDIPVVLFNPFPWSHYLDSEIPKSVGPVPFRDHRKLLIADGVGFCGSMNLQGDVLAREGEEFPRFYDLNARIEGPAVSHLGNVFIDSLDESKVGISRQPFPPPIAKGNSFVQVLQSNVKKQRRAIQKALGSQIKAADSEVLVASSYFMPPGFLKRALLSSRKKRCKILVSGTTDFFPVPGDLMAQTHALSRFINRGPQTTVHLYSRSHMHAKFTAVDNLFVQLGSYNFDRFSARRNLESSVAVFDSEIAAKVSDIHNRLCRESTLATDDGVYFKNPIARLFCWLAYFVAKTSGRNVFDGFDAYSSDKTDNGGSRRRPRFFGQPDLVAIGLKL